MTLREALTRATSQLAANPELQVDALRDAVLLLMHALGVTRATLMAYPERTVSVEEQTRYQAMLQRRLRMEPIQYITGVQEFYGLALKVTAAVLIPRPETELLVEAVLEWVKGLGVPGPGTSEELALAGLGTRLPELGLQGMRQAGEAGAGLRIIDVGTGSGAVALALAKELRGAAIVAVDRSTEALGVARENASTLGLGARVRFAEGDLLVGIPGEGMYDVVVSNPPYVPEGDRMGLAAQVRDWEPALALFAGEDGLAVYRRLIPQAAGVLRVGGLLALEVGYGQAETVAAMLGAWSEVRVIDDLQGIGRVVVAWRR